MARGASRAWVGQCGLSLTPTTHVAALQLHLVGPSMPYGKSNPKKGQESLGKALQRRRAQERAAADRYTANSFGDLPLNALCSYEVGKYVNQIQQYSHCCYSCYLQRR